MSAADLPSLAQTTALIRHRRTIKPVDMNPKRPVDHGLLVELLENATWAPTHGKTEPWRFFVFENEARQQLASALQEFYRLSTPPEQFREDKLRKMGETPLQAQIVIACVMERRGGDKIPEVEEIEAVAAGLENAMLTATAAGLGSFWSTAPLLETEMFKNWLGIRPEDRCVGLMYLGWPKEGLAWPRSTRQPIESRITWRHD